MKFTTMAATIVASLFLLTAGAPNASADLTLYCVGGSSTGCSSVAPVSGNYWTADISMTLNTTLHTFDFTLSLAAAATNTGTAYLQDISGQFFFGSGADVNTLAWVSNPGGWAGPWASKAGNSGSCQGSANGAFCAAQTWNFGGGNSGTQGSLVALGTSATVFELTGSYAGTFLDSNGNWHLQMAAANNSSGGGGNAFAISQDIHGVADGGVTVMLLGSFLFGLETLRRKLRA